MKHRLTFLSLCLALMLATHFYPTAALAQDAMQTEMNAGASTEHANETPAAAPSFPQLDTSTYAKQVFWLFISFVLIYTLMSKIALPKVGAVIDARNTQKETALVKADQMQKEAEQMKTAYEADLARAQGQAQNALNLATDAVNQKNTAENSRFAEHARKRIVTAEAAIAKAKQDALVSLADISADIAADMVNKIAGVQVAKADAKKVVTSVMEKGAA